MDVNVPLTESELEEWQALCDAMRANLYAFIKIMNDGPQLMPRLIAEVRRLRTESSAHSTSASQQLDLHTTAAARAEKAEAENARLENVIKALNILNDSAKIRLESARTRIAELEGNGGAA